MKKLIAFILASVMLVSCIGVSVFAEDDKIAVGDLNRDGKFNLSDVTLILKYIAKWNLGDREFFEVAGDFNSDGKVDIGDVSSYLRWIAYGGLTYVVPTAEDVEWREACSACNADGIPVPTFDEWLTEKGIDPEVYEDYRYEWTYRYTRVSFEDWLAAK